MIQINLTKGLAALIDADDVAMLGKHRWHACGKRGHEYAATRIKGTNKFTYMHHMIFGRPPKGMVIDHINGNVRDNRKINLRFVTIGQNVYNKRKQKTRRNEQIQRRSLGQDR